MTWRVIDHVTIYREEGWYGVHPSVVRTPSGDLMALFHRAPFLGYPHHNHPLFDVRACRSTDDGQAWSPAELVTIDPLGGVLDFGTHTLSDGSIFLHASTIELVQADDVAHGTSFVARWGIPFWVRSRDDGHTWTEPVRFPPLPDNVWGHPASWTQADTNSGVCRSGLLALPNGRLLMPSKATDNADGAQPHFGILRVSDDLGETWSYGGRIVEDPETHFTEPAIHMTPGGRIIVLYRRHPMRNLRGWSTLGLVESSDEGESWSTWRPTTVKGHPGHMLGLRDGRIFVTVGTRWPGQLGCTARVLEPEGSDLDSAPDLVVRADSLEGDTGYPWSVELNDGRVLVVYYYTYPDGQRGIEGTVVEEV